MIFELTLLPPLAPKTCCFYYILLRVKFVTELYAVMEPKHGLVPAAQLAHDSSDKPLDVVEQHERLARPV